MSDIHHQLANVWILVVNTPDYGHDLDVCEQRDELPTIEVFVGSREDAFERLCSLMTDICPDTKIYQLAECQWAVGDEEGISDTPWVVGFLNAASNLTNKT